MSSAHPSSEDVHDVHSQFLIAVAEACQSAAVASFAVELLLVSGETVLGVPGPLSSQFGDGQADETGYADELPINGGSVALEDVIACTILAPGGFGAPDAA